MKEATTGCEHTPHVGQPGTLRRLLLDFLEFTQEKGDYRDR